MKAKLDTAIKVIFLNLLSLSLVFGIVVYRTDFSFAQGGGEDSDTPVLTPRETQVEDESEGDDDDGAGDGDDEPEVFSYVVLPGDNLWRIAQRLGIPYQALAEQTDNPRRIYAGQIFTYSSEQMQGAQNASGVEMATVTISQSGGETYTFTVRPGDTLSHIALWLGVPLEELAQQVENPSRIRPGQQISYVSDQRIDTPPLVTDNDGTDSDGIDTTGNLTDNDGTDSDGIDTTGQLNATDNDGWDTERQEWTDNDGTDSDGIDTTGLQNATDNDGTDSDGIDTTGQQDDTDDTDDSADTDDSD